MTGPHLHRGQLECGHGVMSYLSVNCPDVYRLNLKWSFYDVLTFTIFVNSI